MLGSLGIDEAPWRWTMPIVDWKEGLNDFAIVFKDRLSRSHRNGPGNYRSQPH